jgi:DNA-binding response OmpR family regulator
MFRGVAAILLVETDGPLRARRVTALEQAGFDVTVLGTGREARDHVELAPPDLAIVEHELIDVDGRSLARRFHVWPACPVIVMTATATDPEIAASLDDGTDDVVATFVDVAVLAARVRVQLRHAAAAGDAVGQVLVGDVRLDSGSYEVEIGGRPVQLSRQQMVLLRTLMCRAGRLCTFDLLSRAIGRGAASDDDVNAVRIGVSRLRRILGDGPRRPRIVAERGGGYRLIAPA